MAGRFVWRLATASARPVPEVLILGAQKGGTTSLFSYLVRHPAVLAPFRKEVHYFDLNFRWGHRWYRAHFPTERERARRQAELGREPLTLDASPYYLFHPRAPERAAAVTPGARLLVVLRDPVDRAYSHYHHELRAGREPLSFEEAIEAEEARLRGEEARLRVDHRYYSYNHHRYSYLTRGLYARQLRAWLARFPADRLHVVVSEDLFREPARTLAEVHAFLGVDEEPLREYVTFGVRGAYAPMAAETRSRLAAYFAPHNQELFDLIGRTADWSR
jgi:hypothetical protein